MAEISIVAQNIMDLYYQSFKAEEEFFELSHFEYLAGVAYGKLIQDEYEKNYKKNLQVEGTGFVTISPDWLKKEQHKPEKESDGVHFIELDRKPFGFIFDNQSTAIPSISPVGGKVGCGEFIRISPSDKWQVCSLPETSSVFWYWGGCNKIYFLKMRCKPDKIQVEYIPGFDDEASSCLVIPKTKEADIIDWVLNRMSVARQGGVVDMTNDQNPNKALATEINNIFSKIKTKS